MSSTGRVLRSVFVENIPLKVASVLVAAVLMVMAREETVREIDLDVPLQLSGLPADRVIVGDVPQLVRLRVRGSLEVLANAMNVRTPYVIDLSATRASQAIYLPVDGLAQHLGRNVRVVSVSPPSFEIQLDELSEKTVKVEVDIARGPDEYHKLEPDSIAISPSSVVVAGPRRILDKLQQVRTAPVDLMAFAQSGPAVVDLLVPPGGDLRTPQVSIRVKLAPSIVSRTFAAVPLVARHCRQDLACRPNPGSFSVVVEGPKKTIDSLNTEMISNSIFIDSADMTLPEGKQVANLSAITPVVRLPEGVLLRQLSPRFFTLVLESR